MSRVPSLALLHSQSDERLLGLAREGHERAFEAIVERYRKPLHRACLEWTLAVPHEQRAAPRVEVVLAEGQRHCDASAAAPEHHDHGAQPAAVAVVAGLAHHGDDLFHGRRIGGIEPPLVAGRTSGVIAGHGRGRATPTGGIEHWRDGHGISSQSHSGTQSPPPYRRSRILASGITSRSRSRFARAKRKPAARQPNTRPSSLATTDWVWRWRDRFAPRAIMRRLQTPALARRRQRGLPEAGSPPPRSGPPRRTDVRSAGLLRGH
jgi:hypothetical protein